MLFIKLVVYSLITVNFSVYVVDDWVAAQHELTDTSGLLDYIYMYTTSLSVFAWLALLLIFEVETYWLEDDFDNPPVEILVTAVKVVLLAMILQASVAFTVAVIEGDNVTAIEGVDNICELVSEDYSFYRNLEYTELTTETCRSITNDGSFYLYPDGQVITDGAGLEEDRILRAVDLIENISWLLIIALVQVAVVMQNRGIYQGAAITWVTRGKLLGYAGIVGCSVVWISKGHYIYAWDEFLWIAGFTILEKNLSQWRAEMAETAELPSNPYDFRNSRMPPR